MTDNFSECSMSVIVENKPTLCSPLTLSAFKNGISVLLFKALHPNNGLRSHTQFDETVRLAMHYDVPFDKTIQNVVTLLQAHTSACVDTEEKKLVFLTRQLELLSQKQLFMNDYCFALQSYPKCNYKQFRDFLVLPCKCKLQYITSSIDKDQHHDPWYSEGISVGVTEGTCPPPVHSLPPGLCLASPCTSHMMCYPQKMCCFNGCTYTCTEPVQPPPVVDWLEDSDIRLPILDPLNPALPLRFESSPLSYGTGGGETVRLPGGCSLSATKYEELKEFMTAESIQDCLCSGGEVVCVVKSSPSN
ncbi:WAP-type 'four-disulfide core' domain [Trinorchestia longiramus]|nr:WAP-type 'four-disulfide core' domain [Trinorchestia longiramus]